MGLKNFLENAGESIVQGIEDTVQSIADAPKNIADAVVNAPANIADAVSSAAGNVVDTAKGLGAQAAKVGGFLAEDLGEITKSSEEKAAQKAQEEAEAKKAEEEQKKAEEAEAERIAELEKSYILHTAVLICDCAYTSDGSIHPSFLVTRQDHGVYVQNLPQLNVDDNVPETNIINFGICRSPQNPSVQAAAAKILEEVQKEEKERKKSLTETIMSWFVDDTDTESVCDSQESLAAMCAGECTPKFGTKWLDGKTDVKVDGKNALMGRCKLQCMYGGNVTIYTSGQAE